MQRVRRWTMHLIKLVVSKTKKGMWCMKKYVKRFIEEEDGVEAIEWLAILAVAAALIGVAATIAKEIKARMSNLGNML